MAAASTPALPSHLQRVGFLLLPGFSLAALGAAVDALTQVNVVAGANGARYELSLIGVGGSAVTSSSGVAVQLACGLDNAPPLDAAFVLSDASLPQHGHEQAIAWLQARASPRVVLGGVGTGAWLLARAGLLAGHRATIHWPYAAMFAEDFPDVQVSSNLFEIDRNRLSCASGNASFDLILAWIGQTSAADPAAAGEIIAELMDHFGHERQRGPKEHQRVPLSARIGGGQPKLTEAVTLMEANFEEPLPTEEIARLVGVSRRQLERLFKQYLNSLPSRYYLELRLTRARQLLQKTSQSILQIGLSCGFSSGPHFSSAYRNHFGLTPRDQRSKRLVGAGSGRAPVSGADAPDI